MGPAKEEWDSSKHELLDLMKQVEQIDVCLKRASDEERNQKQELQNKQLQCQRLRQSQGNEVLKFVSGKSMGPRQASDLLHAIGHERRWHMLPVGPLGKHVKVSDPAWTVAVENCIGQQLNTFVCDNSQDSKILGSLLKKHGSNAKIVTSKFGGPR